MTRQPILLAIACAAFACGTDAPSLLGTYQVRVTGTVTGAFPPLYWPDTLTVVLAPDAMGQPSVTLQGASPIAQELTRSGAAIDIRTYEPFPVTLVDPSTCQFPLEWTGDDGAIIAYHFEDGHMDAHTSGVAYCAARIGQLPPEYGADVDFTLAGDLLPAPQAR